MDTTLLSLFIPACFALNLSPGPNNLMAMTTGAHLGVQSASIAALGRLCAFVVMIALASVGLAAVLHTSEVLFYAIKIAGGFYLLYIAWKLWTAKVQVPHNGGPNRTTVIQLARREFLVAAGNPKAILIFTAFLPQFVDSTQPVASQFAILGAIFLVLEWIAATLWSIAGSRLGRMLSSEKHRRIFNRASAGLLGLTGMGLLLARRTG